MAAEIGCRSGCESKLPKCVKRGPKNVRLLNAFLLFSRLETGAFQKSWSLISISKTPYSLPSDPWLMVCLPDFHPMKKPTLVLMALFLAATSLCSVATGASYPFGYISWDVNFTGNAGEFDIVNLTGSNNFPPDFPINTQLDLTNLSLVVSFTDGSTTTFGPSYFTLSSDGHSFDGSAIPIGGTNPLPDGFTLSGMFTPTTGIDVEGVGTVDIEKTFTVTFSDSPNLVDGDLAIIYVQTTTQGVPETGQTLGLLLIAIATLVAVRRLFRSPGRSRALAGKLLVGGMCLTIAHVASARAIQLVKLAASTAPSSGAAGVNNVNITGSNFPSGTITAHNIVVTFASSCGGAAVATANANSYKVIIGSTARINVDLPSTLTTGDYFVTVADNAAGDANFATAPGSCSRVKVTGSTQILNACVAGSSLGVLLPAGGNAGTVTAYVPIGYWGGFSTGIFVKNIEGTLGPGSTIATPNIVNSCSSNPATGETVCVANNTDVYRITGTSLNSVLTSGSDTFAFFSGGSCMNCGVAVNANNNTAFINGGFSGPSGTGVQILDLATGTFASPFRMFQQVSENISVDPTRSLVLSANEGGNYALLQLQTNGSLLEFDATFNPGLEDDSSAEDCSTGVAIAPGEFTTDIQLVNLNAAVLTSGSPGSYTAPNSVNTLVTSYSFGAGVSGSAVAQGSGHLGVVADEFGGSAFAVVKLPATAGSGTPALADYAVALVPAGASCGGSFSFGFDPHTQTAYTSPNTGHSMAVFAGYSGGVPVCLALVDMTVVIDPLQSPRGGAGLQAHDISAANLPA